MSEIIPVTKIVTQPRSKKLEIGELKTPENYLAFAQSKIKENYHKLATTKSEWFISGPTAQERAEAICEDLDRLHKIYLNGGTIGTRTYLPNDLPVHNFNHVAFQTALRSDVSTHLAVADPKNVPYDIQEQQEFSYSHYVTELYSSIFHESGYLREVGTREANYPGAILVQTHEERGVDFATNAHQQWNLAQKGINIEQLSANILATKMARQKPFHFMSFSELSLAKLSHLVDLASYAVAPDYVPNGITGLWWEFQPETLEGESLAELKFATGSQTAYVVSGFMLPGEFKKEGMKSFRWGEGPKCLFTILQHENLDVFRQWNRQYETNIQKLLNAQEVLLAPKSNDALLVETSLDPHELRRLAQKYGVMSVYQAGINEAIANQIKEGASVYERLPTYFVREVFQAIAKGRRQEFLTEVITLELEDMAQQYIQEVEIKLTPLAWQMGAGEPLKDEVQVTTSTFIDAFMGARRQFIEKNQAYAADEKGEKVRLAITLRREDKDLNMRLINELKGGPIYQVDIAGDERDGRELTPQLIEVIRQTRRVLPNTRIGINLGQMGKNETGSGFSQWQAISGREKVDALLYPAELMKNSEFKEHVFSMVKTQGLEVVVLPIESALQLGYSISEVVAFIRDFLASCPEGTLRLQSINNFMESLTLQILKLKNAENGLNAQELSHLGITLPNAPKEDATNTATAA